MGKFSPHHIDIRLDTTPQGILGTFVPGQTIAGKILYTPQTQVDIDKIIIVCKGTCYTVIKESSGAGNNRQTTRYPEKIILFRDQETLFQGPHTIPSRTYEWPFRFQLPLGAIHQRKSDSGDNRFQLGEQGLPPSFKFKGEASSDPPEAEVRYYLKVKVNPGRLMHSTEHACELPIWPVSLTPLKTPLPLDGPCQGDGRFKSNELRSIQHTFKEKMRHAFTSDPSLKTPEINIAVSFKMPRSVGVAQNLPLEVSCKHTRTGENDPESPRLVVEACVISLKACVEARALGTRRDHYDDGKQTVISHRVSGSGMILPSDGTFVPATEPIRLAEMTRHVHGLVPSFSTFTIAMHYKMVVKVRIRHVDSGHLWKFENKFPFEILPSELPVPAYTKQISDIEAGPSALYPPQLPVGDQASSSSTAPPETLDDLAPPSYISNDVWKAGSRAKELY